MDPAIIVDDALTETYLPKVQWIGEKGDQLLNGTRTVARNPGSLPPKLLLNFYGSDFAIYGPPLARNATLRYTISGTSDRLATDLNTTAPATLKSGVRLWQLEGLAPGFYSLSLTPSDGFAFDYITYKPYRSTTFTRRMVVVDDADGVLAYSGSWEKLQGTRTADGIPYRNTLSKTTSSNSTLRYYFTGSSISVMGALNQQPGRLVVQYQVDAFEPQTITHFDGKQQSQPGTWEVNKELFQRDLAPNRHNVTVTVLESSGDQALYIDSLMLEGTSSTSLDNLKTGQVPPTSTSTSSSGSGSSNKISTSLVTGIVITFVVLCLLGAFCGRRAKRKFITIRVNQPSGPPPQSEPLPMYTPPVQPVPPPQHPLVYDLPPMSSMSGARFWGNEQTQQQMYTPPTATTPMSPYHDMPVPLVPAASTHPFTPSVITSYQNSSAHSPAPAPAPAPVPPPAPAPATVEPPQPTRPRVQPEEHDAGPVDAPPPYNPANYIR